MEYRQLGNTGKSVGIIGLGCEHLDGKPYAQVDETINAAIESGVNIFDIFMPGQEVRENIAKAMGAKRKDVMIQGHIGSTDVNEQYDISRDLPTVQKYFENLLRLFGYVDFGMMFFIDSEEEYKKVFETGFASYVQKLKQNGDIRHIGFSSHNPIIAMKVIETGLPEMMMFSVNPAFDMLPTSEYSLDVLGSDDFKRNLLNGIDPTRAELYKLCTQKQVGITVMKSLGGGKLISDEHTPFSKPLTVTQCLHYALTRPAVASVMLGCKTAGEVEAAMQYLTATDVERDYAEVIAAGKNDFKGNCVYCGHCQPCPVDIDIAAVNKYLDIARLTPDNVPPSIASHYHSLSAHGSDCIACGSCEARCPFGVSIIDNMAAARELFE